MAEKSSELDRINEPDAVSTTAGASQDSYLATRDSDTSLSNDRLTDGVVDSDETTDETEQIREKIEETRSNMSETIDAIQEKLSISNISEQVKEQVSEHISSAVEAAKDSVYDATIGKVGEFMKTVGREFSKTDAGKVAKDNPVPLLLIGLGVGLLAYQGMYGSKSRRTYRYDEYSGAGEIYRGHEDYDYDETEFFGGRTQSNRSTLRSAKGKISNVARSYTLQNFGNQNAAVRLLVIFQNRNPSSSDRQTRTVQRVNEFGFRAARALETQIHSPRLKISAVRAARNFAVSFLARQPDFDVVSFHRAETHIAG
jgi:hypothetical protein